MKGLVVTEEEFKRFVFLVNGLEAGILTAINDEVKIDGGWLFKMRTEKGWNPSRVVENIDKIFREL